MSAPCNLGRFTIAQQKQSRHMSYLQINSHEWNFPENLERLYLPQQTQNSNLTASLRALIVTRIYILSH